VAAGPQAHGASLTDTVAGEPQGRLSASGTPGKGLPAEQAQPKLGLTLVCSRKLR